MTLHAATQDSFEKLAQNMGEMIEGMFRKTYVGFRPTKTWEPPINVYEEATCLIVCVELAGMRREGIDVQVVPGRLIVRGSRPDPQWSGGQATHRVHLLEIHHGPFERTIELPADLDVDGATAQYRNGYLWIQLPRTAIDETE